MDWAWWLLLCMHVSTVNVKEGGGYYRCRALCRVTHYGSGSDMLLNGREVRHRFLAFPLAFASQAGWFCCPSYLHLGSRAVYDTIRT